MQTQDLIASLHKIEANPKFKALSYNEQMKVRQSWADANLGLDPAFVALTPAQKLEAYKGIIQKKPIFESDADPVIEQYKAVNDGIRMGDRASIDRAKGRLVATETTRQSVLGNVVAGVTSVMEGGTSYNTTYGKDGQKLNQMLLQSLNESPLTTDQELSNLQAQIGAGSFAVNAVEGLLMNVGLVGSVGKAGLLTKGLFGEGGRVLQAISKIPAGVKYGIAKEIGEQVVQSTLMGVVSTAQNASILALQHPELKNDLGEAAKYLGQDMLFDWALWAGIAPAMTGARAMFRSLKGFDADSLALRKMINGMGEDAFNAKLASFMTGVEADPAFLDALRKEAPAVFDEVTVHHNGAKAALAATKNGLDTPKGKATSTAYTAGYILTENKDGLIELRPRENVEVIHTFKDLDEATRFSLSNSERAPVEVGVGKAQDLVWTREYKTKLLPKTQYSVEQQRRIISPEAGRVSLENTKFFIANLSESSGVADDIGKRLSKAEVKSGNSGFMKANVVEDVKANRLTVPNDISTPAMEKRFKEYLYNYSREIGKLDSNPAIAEGINKRVAALEKHIGETHLVNTGSLISLRSVAKDTLGMDVKFSSGGKISLDGVEYPTASKAYQEVYARLLDSGKLDMDQTKQLLKNLTGLSLEVKTGETGAGVQTSYVLRRENGGIVHQESTLPELLRNTPELETALVKPLLPEHLGPSTWIVDASSGEATIKDGVVIGSAKSLSDIQANFFSLKRTVKGGYKLVDTVDGKAVALDVKNKLYKVYDPATGAEVPFADAKEAKTFINKEIKSWSNLQRELHLRGLYTNRSKNGVLQVFDSDGQQTDLRTVAETEAFLKNHPVPGYKELVAGDTAEFEAISATNKLAVDQKNNVGKVRKAVNSVIRSQTFSQILMPTESALEDVFVKSGNPQLVKEWRSLSAAMRVVNAKNVEASSIIDAIWMDVKLHDYPFLTALLETTESEWATVAKTANREITDDMRKAITRTKEYYKALNDNYGVSGANTLKNYTPRIRDYVSQITSKGVELPTNTKTMLQEIFGKDIPKDLGFFAENMRRDMFMEAVMDTNPYRTMQVYTNQLHKKAYLGSSLEVISRGMADLKKAADDGNISEASRKFFVDSVLEMMGHKTTLGRRMQETSIKLTTSLYNNVVMKLEKLPIFKDADLKSKVIKDDLIGALGSYFTLSTQAGRIWAIPRNLTQVSLLGAIVGNKDAWDGFAYAVKHPEYINGLIKKGYFSESLYHNHDLKSNPTKNLIQMSMNPLENSDMITRASSFKAAELAYDRSVVRYKKGLIDKKAFLDEMNGDILDPSLQKDLLDLTDQGRESAAKEILGRKFTDMSMFNYGKGQQGTSFRGVAGRLFGKLGVYPMGAISLYRDVLTRGSPSRVLARTARYVATTSAIYWAFKSVGIDYQGFLWSDPFEFSGGPYWSMMNDLMAAMGSGNDSAMAKAKLLNSAGRIAVPSVFRYMADAGKYASEGRFYEAFMSLQTAPMSKSLKEWGVIESPFDSL